MCIELRGIMISSAFFCNGYISLFFKIADYALNGSLGDVDSLSDVSHAKVGLATEEDEDVCVIRKESPISHGK